MVGLYANAGGEKLSEELQRIPKPEKNMLGRRYRTDYVLDLRHT
jgi:hypothetical protein